MERVRDHRPCCRWVHRYNVVEPMPYWGIAAVTKNSMATTKIVAGRMLAVPEIASCMADFD